MNSARRSLLLFTAVFVLVIAVARAADELPRGSVTSPGGLKWIDAAGVRIVEPLA